MDKEEKQAVRKKIEEILSGHGIEMMVDGCGCCDSPWVSFRYNGETILDWEEGVKINNLAGIYPVGADGVPVGEPKLTELEFVRHQIKNMKTIEKVLVNHGVKEDWDGRKGSEGL